MGNTLSEHLGYLADERRLDAFRAAVNQVVKSEDRVADVGCGTGILGLLCLQSGASLVYAIDSSNALGVAQESLGRSPWSPNVQFIRGSSFQVQLPQLVDVVICDHIGYFGFDYGVVELMADARRRFLKAGGRLIPQRLNLQVGAVQSEKCYALADGWRSSVIPTELHRLRTQGINTKYAVTLERDDLLSTETMLGTIDLTLDNPGYFSWSVSVPIVRDGAVHGIAGWFNCELADGLWMTNSPLSDKSIKRHQAFLPIEEPLQVSAGDTVDLTVLARPADGLVSWEVRHPPSGKKFSHSTWLGELLTAGQLGRSQPSHVPRLSASARARSTVLALCDGQRSVSEIQAGVRREHPDLFPSEQEISRFVLSVLSSDTE